MKRLTQRDGAFVYTTEKESCYMNGYSRNSVSHFCENTHCKALNDRSCPYLRVFDRLAAYEDTGLTPEQVKATAVALEMARKEHTALLADIKYVGDKCNGDACFICKFHDPENDVCVCPAHCTGEYWEWRGVMPNGD